MSNDTPQPQQNAVADPDDNDWAERVSGYIERALLIVVGATVTVVAGFLSQVWGSAGTAFRTELATNLKALGLLFVMSFALPSLRFAVELYKYKNPKKSGRAFSFWCCCATIVFIIYGHIIDQLGDIVLKYAKAG